LYNVQAGMYQEKMEVGRARAKFTGTIFLFTQIHNIGINVCISKNSKQALIFQMGS